MSNKNNTNNNPRLRGQYIADPTADPVSYDEIMSQMGFAGERVRAADIVGKSFTLLRAKPYKSTMEEGKQVFFCVIMLDGAEEENTVSLGGTAIVEAINDVLALGMVNPLHVTLLRKEGEKDTDRYYYFG